MKPNLIPFLLIIFFAFSIKAQVGINASNTLPNPGAMLDVSSTSKGMLIPRMTTPQKNAIANSIQQSIKPLPKIG